MANLIPTINDRTKEAIPLYEKLNAEWKLESPNISKIDELLNLLKVLSDSQF